MLENINKNPSIFRATVLRMQYNIFYNSQNDEPVKSKGRASFLHVKEISSRGDKKVRAVPPSPTCLCVCQDSEITSRVE